MEILRPHDAAIRSKDFVGGAIFSVTTTTVLTRAIAVWVRCSSAPGSETKLELVFTQPEAPVDIQIDVLRPTSFSACSLDWKP